MTNHDTTTAINQMGYDRWSTFYDHYANPTVAADDLAFPPLWQHLTGLNILEIGCGTGRHTVRLATRGNRVTGVDLSHGMLSLAKAKLAGLPVTLIQGDVMAGIHIPGAPFDAAVTALVIEHIGDLPGFFAHMRALLKPAAPFYICEIHPDRTAQGTFAHFKTDDGDEVTLAGYPHSATDVEHAAGQAGFRVDDCQDVLGHAALSALNPKWERHQGRPMLKMWVLRLQP